MRLFTHGMLRHAAMLAIACSLSACATELHKNVGLAKSQNTEFVVSDLTTSTRDQMAILAQLQLRAGLNPDTQPLATDWDNIIDAGVEYANAKCEAYMGALVRLNRDKKTISSQLGLVGTATAGVMAAAQSAAREIAMAAIAFGLAGSTVDNLSGNVLYEVDPSSVRAMVNTLQAGYSNAIKKGYLTRPAAMNVIRAYAALCTPANIEAELNHAIKKAQPKVESGDPATGKAPAVTNADTALREKYAPGASGQLLNKYVYVDGKVVTDRLEKVKLIMKILEIDKNDSPVVFINSAAYANERVAALQLIQLIK